MPAPGMTLADVNLRAVLRIVLVIVGVVVVLYLLYLLRKPIGWIVLATFIAVAMSAPVNLLARHMHRGLAIGLAYLGLLLVPVVLARRKYADRYASEKFWRIPGGMVGVWITVLVGSLGTIGGIYYSFAKSWIKDVPDSTWMVWTGSIATGMFLLGVVVYIFGRRSAHKTSAEDALAHLAVLELKDEAK